MNMKTIPFSDVEQAVRVITGFARMLAGTDKKQAASTASSLVDNAPEIAPRMEHASPPSSRPVWSETLRPGPHDILTWDEVRQVPWIEGSAAHQR